MRRRSARQSVRQLARRNRQLSHNESKMDFSSRNSRLLSTFGLMGFLTFLIRMIFMYIEGLSRSVNIETKIPINTDDVLSAFLMSSVLLIFFRLVLYCYHEFSSLTVEVDDEMIRKSDDSYRKVIFLIPFLFGLNSMVMFVMAMTTTTLEVSTIILVVFIFIILLLLINIVPLGNINLGFSYRWKIELSLLLLSSFFIYVNISNINLNIGIDILFKNDGQIEYNLLGPMPQNISVTIINSKNKVLVEKQVEETDMAKAFLEYTQTTNYDQIPNNNIKSIKTINMDDSFYKYSFADSIDNTLFEENMKYTYVIKIQYNGYYEEKNLKVVNEFYYRGGFHFTEEVFAFSE